MLRIVLDSEEIKPQMYENMNKSLTKWLLHLRSDNISVNGLLLEEKTCEFAKELGVSNFQALDGWIEKWKKRQFVFNLNILMNYFSAVNYKVQGTLIPFTSPRLTGFRQTTAKQSLFSVAFKQ